MSEGAGKWGIRAHWLTALAIAAVLGVNAAGLWGIAVARRGADEEVARLFRLETEARARKIESALSETRADLAFLAGSSAVSRLEGLGRPAAQGDEEWRRLAAEAVLVFLRGHPEVSHLTVRSEKGRAVVRTGRRGGIPVLWTSSEEEGDTPSGGVRAAFAFGPAGRDVVGLEAEIDPAIVLAEPPAAAGAVRCALQGPDGQVLAFDPGAHGDPPESTPLQATAFVNAEGWSSPPPWTLECRGSRRSTPAALLDPVARRYRLTLGLNLGAMALAVLLGSFAIQQARRRERLEALSREERRTRELERQLFHAERLGTVGRLAAGMAHEINNPLEGMANYLSLAREDLKRGDIASSARRLEGVREGMQRIAGIVGQVLAHADPAGAPRTPVEVGSLVRQTLDFVTARREFAHIAFSVDVGEGPAVVQGSTVTLSQVLLNIVLNACEAQPRGGEVRVAAFREGPQVVIEVSDRGPGIPAGDLHRVFEPFYSTKQSTGLGLSICHAIVRQHDGDLEAGNRSGGGAQFRIRLPAS